MQFTGNNIKIAAALAAAVARGEAGAAEALRAFLSKFDKNPESAAALAARNPQLAQALGLVPRESEWKNGAVHYPGAAQ